MATIFTLYDNHGPVGSCDGKCHNAKQPTCRCICGGTFHGVGPYLALLDRNTLKDKDLIKDNVRLCRSGILRVKRLQNQIPLFEDSPTPRSRDL